jgi:hypothetical protein
LGKKGLLVTLSPLLAGLSPVGRAAVAYPALNSLADPCKHMPWGLCSSSATFLWSFTMKSGHVGVVLFVSLGFFPGRGLAGGDDYKAAVTAAARELSRQLTFLQQAIANIPGPTAGRGIYQQGDQVQLNLVFFQQHIKRAGSREELILNFDRLDQKLEQLLGDIKGFEKWDVALRYVVRKVQAAENDLHFAVFSGDEKKSSQVAYRQTLVLLDKTANLDGMYRYRFEGLKSLKPWNEQMKALRQALGSLQKLQKTKKPAPQDLKNQFQETEQAWEKLLAIIKNLPKEQYILLRSDAAQLDQVFFRLARIYGLKIDRTPLADPLAF